MLVKGKDKNEVANIMIRYFNEKNIIYPFMQIVQNLQKYYYEFITANTCI